MTRKRKLFIYKLPMLAFAFAFVSLAYTFIPKEDVTIFCVLVGFFVSEAVSWLSSK